MLNTYFPPNQPTPARLARRFAHGRKTSGLLLSRPAGRALFTVDPDRDRLVLDAFFARNGEALGNILRVRLNSGNSEIRNWTTVAGASGELVPE